MGVKRKLQRAGLSSLAAVCAALVLLTPASAQSGGPAEAKSRDAETELFHGAPLIPATPSDYHPITADGRLQWFTRATAGPKSLVWGLFSAGIGTAGNWPHEYGTHWTGFAQRYGMRLTGVSTSNAIEAGMGAVWGEDPRYFRTIDQPFKARVGNVVDLTFRAYRSDGERHLAYARFLAVFGNNFLSNTWRVPSESNVQHALIRSGEGFGARFLSDAFKEFAPTVWRKLRHRRDPYPASATGQ